MDVYLIHAKAGSPDGSSLHLEELLRPALPDAVFHRPLLPHADPSVAAEASLDALRDLALPPEARVIGISLGGLLAARLQESGRPDLHVVAISSPTWADNVYLAQKPKHRVAIYSSTDEVLGGSDPENPSANRTVDWPRLADAYDLRWLTHDTKAHKNRIAPLLLAWLQDKDIPAKRVPSGL